MVGVQCGEQSGIVLALLRTAELLTSVFFRPCFSVVAESVSEQLLQRTGGLGGQFWLSKESVSTSATDCRIPTPICTKYGLQKVRTCKIDGLYR